MLYNLGLQGLGVGRDFYQLLMKSIWPQFQYFNVNVAKWNLDKVKIETMLVSGHSREYPDGDPELNREFLVVALFLLAC